MVNLSRRKLLHAFMVALALIFASALGSRLACASEVCAPNDPCSCQDCCASVYTITYQCSPSGTCTVHICVGGQHASLGATSECTTCCGEQAQDWYVSGSCYITSPVRQKPSAGITDPQLYFVRGCDGTYSLLTLGAAS